MPSTGTDTSPSGEEGGLTAHPEPSVAVIDRVEEQFAVLLIEGTNDELVIPLDALPADAGEQDVVRIRWDEGAPVVVGVEHAETADRKVEAERRLQNIRDTRSGGRFNRG